MSLETLRPFPDFNRIFPLKFGYRTVHRQPSGPTTSRRRFGCRYSRRNEEGSQKDRGPGPHVNGDCLVVENDVL